MGSLDKLTVDVITEEDITDVQFKVLPSLFSADGIEPTGTLEVEQGTIYAVDLQANVADGRPVFGGITTSPEVTTDVPGLRHSYQRPEVEAEKAPDEMEPAAPHLAPRPDEEPPARRTSGDGHQWVFFIPDAVGQGHFTVRWLGHEMTYQINVVLPEPVPEDG